VKKERTESKKTVYCRIETTQAQRGRDAFLDIFIEIQANE
jgi:hypothetical protein